ncbi:Cell death activator CIDE-A [Microtus ochrogaster]|uniref:Lipid transferase CIDEA n=1 Tax=Microtus ochrogaster TaxID=79684 RepID=A0A8J6GM55_MICOH|nr:Cell death activator CIDE-A [Microtus ochrogaster]
MGAAAIVGVFEEFLWQVPRGKRPLTFMGLQTKKALLTPLMHPARPFRVSNHDRSSRRGVMASSLQELISKTLDVLLITTGLVTLVLEEDGTVVDSEEFFQTLRDNTHFMILEKGQKWTPGSKYVPVYNQPRKSGIARVTFDLYRLNPKDFLGCLNIKATMYEMYSVSYDIRCTSAKAMLRPRYYGSLLGSIQTLCALKVVFRGCHDSKMIAASWELSVRSLLRFVSYAAQVAGQFLVCAGTYMLRVLADTDEQRSPKSPKPNAKGWFM